MSSMIFEEAMPGSLQEKIKIISAINILLTKMEPKEIQERLDERRAYLGHDAEIKYAMEFIINANKTEKNFIRQMIDAKNYLTPKANPLIRKLTAENLHNEIASKLASELSTDNPNLKDNPNLARVKIIEYANNQFFKYANQLIFALGSTEDKVTLQQITDAFSKEDTWEDFKNNILKRVEENSSYQLREVRDLFENFEYIKTDANERGKDFDIKTEITGSDIVSEPVQAQISLKDYKSMMQRWETESKELKEKPADKFKFVPPPLQKTVGGVLHLKQRSSDDQQKEQPSESPEPPKGKGRPKLQ